MKKLIKQIACNHPVASYLFLAICFFLGSRIQRRTHYVFMLEESLTFALHMKKLIKQIACNHPVATFIRNKINSNIITILKKRNVMYVMLQ